MESANCLLFDKALQLFKLPHAGFIVYVCPQQQPQMDVVARLLLSQMHNWVGENLCGCYVKFRILRAHNVRLSTRE